MIITGDIYISYQDINASAIYGRALDLSMVYIERI